MRDMKRVNDVLNHKLFKELIEKIEVYEEEREFCRHNMDHFMTVARIAYIISLEENINIKKDIIYATGLLHDIGRVKQYEEGIDHHIAGVPVAKEILDELEFTDEEKSMMLSAIGSHKEGGPSPLEDIIYRSDKLSRECFKCKAIEECYWSEEKKNKTILF